MLTAYSTGNHCTCIQVCGEHMVITADRCGHACLLLVVLVLLGVPVLLLLDVLLLLLGNFTGSGVRGGIWLVMLALYRSIYPQSWDCHGDPVCDLVLFYSSVAGCHCSTDLRGREGGCRTVSMGSCLSGGWRRGSWMLFLVAILHDNFQDAADVLARLLEFPLCQVDKCALDICPEYLRRSLWPHRLLQSEDLLASLAVDAMLP